MGRKKRFYTVAITFYISPKIKSVLDTIPNASQFMREAIEEKIKREMLINE